MDLTAKAKGYLHINLNAMKETDELSRTDMLATFLTLSATLGYGDYVAGNIVDELKSYGIKSDYEVLEKFGTIFDPDYIPPSIKIKGKIANIKPKEIKTSQEIIAEFL